jgi:transposase InsO family protein
VADVPAPSTITEILRGHCLLDPVEAAKHAPWQRFERARPNELWQEDLPHCQRTFDIWRQIYNHQRPHEALGLAVPASRYSPSLINFPEQLPEPEYDEAGSRSGPPP